MSLARAEPSAASPLGAIVELEEALAAFLSHPRPGDHRSPVRLDIARRWSIAIWRAAESRGSPALKPTAIARGLELAERPVFICGAHRSGTTLLRNLLDGHSALAVLPAEGSFYTNLERRLAGLPGRERAAEMGQEWIRRMANPTNDEPFWLLGRSTGQSSPYVEFARRMQAWWAFWKSRNGGGPSLWPLTAVALAYADMHREAGISRTPRMWVEKTPANERYLDRLWKEFPAARVLHLIRQPEATLASHKTLQRARWHDWRTRTGVLRNLARSYRIAAKQRERASPDRYLLVRYEELVADRDRLARQIATFLCIEPHAILLEPTVAGIPAARNSSFPNEEARSALCLSAMDRILLKAAVGVNAARLARAATGPDLAAAG